MTDDLTNRLQSLADAYPKPGTLQNVWSDDYPGEVASYNALHALDWSCLDDASLRNFGVNVALMHARAWCALIPHLMISGLRRPYLVWEYDGNLVQDMLSNMQSSGMSTAPHIREALIQYLGTERAVVIDWLRWSATQTPNLAKLSDYDRDQYIALRKTEHQTAIEAISSLAD